MTGNWPGSAGEFHFMGFILFILFIPVNDAFGFVLDQI
jgi:hypothetical protein